MWFRQIAQLSTTISKINFKIKLFTIIIIIEWNYINLIKYFRNIYNNQKLNVIKKIRIAYPKPIERQHSTGKNKKYFQLETITERLYI